MLRRAWVIAIAAVGCGGAPATSGDATPITPDAAPTGLFVPAGALTAGTNPYAIAIADLDRDGNPDLVVANAGDAQIGVFLGTGAAAFGQMHAYAVGMSPTQLAVGDFNRDGIADVVVVGASDFTAQLLLGKGDGTFAPAVVIGTASSVAAGDVDGDGNLDLVGTGTHGVLVYLGHGDGTFAPAVTYAADAVGFTVALGDLDGDGALDVVVTTQDAATQETGVAVLRNTGGGVLGALSAVQRAGAIDLALGDVDGDGHLDALSLGQQLYIMLGHGDATFADARMTSPNPIGELQPSLTLGDLNGDGRLDVVVANNSSELGGAAARDVAVVLNDGHASFAASDAYPTGDYPSDVAIGDLDGDGRADLAVSNQDGTISILLGSAR